MSTELEVIMQQMRNSHEFSSNLKYYNFHKSLTWNVYVVLHYQRQLTIKLNPSALAMARSILEDTVEATM